MNQKEYRDDAFETIRDLLSDNESIDEIKKQFENTYPDVHPNTFYKRIKNAVNANWINPSNCSLKVG